MFCHLVLSNLFFFSVFCSLSLPSPKSSLFPYTTLFRSIGVLILSAQNVTNIEPVQLADQLFCLRVQFLQLRVVHLVDRKSTRLNSSHRCISYAVFCLKKKNCKTYHPCLSQAHPTSRRAT